MKKNDPWSEWLLEHRFGGDKKQRRIIMEKLLKICRKVISNARLSPDKVLLDVGCGDGLIGFSAIKKLGLKGKVIFCDISKILLEHCKYTAKNLKKFHQCEFLCADATDLSQINGMTVDAVTTRSVLIYVNDKSRAFQEFHRVLRLNGRLSLFEPVHSWFWPGSKYFFGEYNLKPIQPLVMKIRTNLREQRIEDDPMLNFDEHYLLDCAERAGFTDITLDVHVRIKHSEPKNWENFLDIQPNPRALNLREILKNSLTKTETEKFMSYLRPLVETGEGIERTAMVYLSATR